MTEPTPDELKSRLLPRLQQELDLLRQASDATAAGRKPVELDQQSVGRLTRMDAMQQQAMAAAQDARRHARIWALEAAIRRIESAEYGWCDSCGEYIGGRRLDLEPTAMRCRNCAG